MAIDIKMHIMDAEFKNYLRMILKNMGNLRGFFITVIPIIHRSIVANFRQGGRPSKWHPLQPGTILKRKEEKSWPGFGGGQPILMRFGTLFQSIGSVKVVGRTSLMYGTNLKKAAGIQMGRQAISGIANIPAHTRKNGAKVKAHKRKFSFGKVPARPFVLFQPYDIKLIISYAAAFAFDPGTARRISGVNGIDMSGGTG
jgi:phage gpG-like protein